MNAKTVLLATLLVAALVEGRRELDDEGDYEERLLRWAKLSLRKLNRQERALKMLIRELQEVDGRGAFNVGMWPFPAPSVSNQPVGINWGGPVQGVPGSGGQPGGFGVPSAGGQPGGIGGPGTFGPVLR